MEYWSEGVGGAFLMEKICILEGEMKVIRDGISKVVAKLGFPDVEFVVEHPADESHGDYSSNVALILAKQEGKSPRELAEEIKGELEKVEDLSKIVKKIEVAGAGFVNFTLKNEWLVDRTSDVVEQGERYGASEVGVGKRVIVEYSSPNIAKPFTVGHLRSTIIGDAIANLLEATGWEVMRDNHLGDWGTQFGKQIYAIKTWGDEKKIGESDNPVHELVQLYIKFHEEAEDDEELVEKGRVWFKRLEDGDKEARELWKKCVDWSWQEFGEIYEILGVTFSEEFDGGRGLGEAFFEDKMDVPIEELKKKKMLQDGDDGAKLVFFPDDKYPPIMILKKDGATLYATRDLATDKYRKEKYNPDLIINEVGAEQTLYFRQIYEIEKMLGWYEDDQRVHVAHGHYRFPDGKMSTRKGNVIWLREVLNEAIKRAVKLADGDERVGESVGIGALKWNDLKGDPKREIVFDWDEVLNMQGNSGPYLQYTYARTQSVLRKAGKVEGLIESKGLNEEEEAILRWIYRYPEVVRDAAREYAPNKVAVFIYELASRYNAFYNQHRILDSKESLGLRLLLTKAVGQTIKNGLGILGIKTPAKM